MIDAIAELRDRVRNAMEDLQEIESDLDSLLAEAEDAEAEQGEQVGESFFIAEYQGDEQGNAWAESMPAYSFTEAAGVVSGWQERGVGKRWRITERKTMKVVVA